jgi:hypothetical protein
MSDDPDNPELTDEDFARMRPASEVLPPEVMDAFKRTRAARLERDEASKPDALRAAVEVGLEDVRQGRVVRLVAGEVGAFVANLGRTGEPEA